MDFLRPPWWRFFSSTVFPETRVLFFWHNYCIVTGVDWYFWLELKYHFWRLILCSMRYNFIFEITQQAYTYCMCYWRRSGVFIFNFEHTFSSVSIVDFEQVNVSLVMVRWFRDRQMLLLLTLNRFHTVFWCFHCELWKS